MKGKPTKWEKISAYQTPNKGLTSKIYFKTHTIAKKKKKAVQFHFSEEDIQVDNSRNTRSCSTSLLIRETQIKITIRYRSTPVRIAIIKQTRVNKCWQGCGEMKTLVHCWYSRYDWKLLHGTTKIVLMCKLTLQRQGESYSIDPRHSQGPWTTQHAYHLEAFPVSEA